VTANRFVLTTAGGDKKGGFGGVLPVAPVVAPATAVAPMAIAPMQTYGGKKGYRRDADHDVERRSCDGGHGGYGGWGVFSVANPNRLC
jgi:hypothetical protein